MTTSERTIQWGPAAHPDLRSNIPELSFAFDEQSQLPTEAISGGDTYTLYAAYTETPASTPDDSDIAEAKQALTYHLEVDLQEHAQQVVDEWWEANSNRLLLHKQLIDIPDLGIQVRHIHISTPTVQNTDSWAVIAAQMETLVFGKKLGFTPRSEILFSFGETPIGDQNATESYDPVTDTSVMSIQRDRESPNQIDTLFAQSATVYLTALSLQGKDTHTTTSASIGMAASIQHGMSFERMKETYTRVVPHHEEFDAEQLQHTTPSPEEAYAIYGALFSYLYEQVLSRNPVAFEDVYTRWIQTNNFYDAIRAGIRPYKTEEDLQSIIDGFIQQLNISS